MEKKNFSVSLKKVLEHIFIDGLSGMAIGLFSTLIIGTITEQIGVLLGGYIGNMMYLYQRSQKR